MRAIIQDNQWINFDNITTHEEDILWNNLCAFENNRYIDTNNSVWDGVLRKYNRAKRRAARPFLGLIRQICQEHKLPLVVKDLRSPTEYQPIPLEQINENLLPGIKLDAHQVTWARTVHSTEIGICDTPTGGGKGEMIACTCKVIPCPTIILADMKVVIDQLKERLELRCIAEEIGLFYAGKRPNGQSIVVGAVQSLAMPNKAPRLPTRNDEETDKAWQKRLDKYGISMRAYRTRIKNAKFLQEYVKAAHMIIVDECDKATAAIYKTIFRHWFRGRRRYGFSGTAFDPEKPKNNLIVQEHLGSIIMRESRQNLEAIGRIIPTEYISIAFGEDGSIHEASTLDIATDDWMVNNDKFHALIAGICHKHREESTLILVERERLGHALVEKLAQHGIVSHFIYGKTPKRRRDQVLSDFEKKTFPVLIGGKIINRGLDLDGGCDNLIIATGGKLRSGLLQKVGRALRRNSKGKSRIYDIYFRCNKHLYGHSRNRLRIMVEAGYKTLVICKNGIYDGAKLVQAQFRFSKKLLRSSSERGKSLF